jgi:hypothetical protein
MKKNVHTCSPVSKLNGSNRKKQKPLDWFLAQPHPLDRVLAHPESFCGTRWEELARQYASKPFDVDAFRAGLQLKLERLYRAKLHRQLYLKTEGPPGSAKTFKQILEDAGVLDVLLAEDTLRELWKSDVLSRISRRSEEMDREQLSVDGTSIDEHKQRVRAMEKELRKFRKIAVKNNFEYIEVAPDRLLQKIIDERIAILTWQRMGPKERILRGPRRAAGRGRTGGRWMDDHAVRNEDTAIQANIYRTLKTRLQNVLTRKNGISDIFLCQLAELVFSAPNVTYITDGKTLYKSIERIIKFLHQ